MKASTGASIVILKERIKALESKLHATELMAEATLDLHQKSLDVAASLLQKFVQRDVMTAVFSNWYWTQIKRGELSDQFNSIQLSMQDQERVEEFMATFTQKHYELLAGVIREARVEISSGKGSHTVEQIHDKLEGVAQLQLKLMKLLTKDNPKFKELIFIGAASEHAPKAKR